MRDYGALFLGERHLRLVRRQGDRHQPRAADPRRARATPAACGSGKYLKTVTYQEVTDEASSAALGELCGRAVAGRAVRGPRPVRRRAARRSSAQRELSWTDHRLAPSATQCLTASPGARRSSPAAATASAGRWRPPSPSAVCASCVAGRTASTLEDTSAALRAAGHDARVVLVDVSDPESVAALARRRRRRGDLDPRQQRRRRRSGGAPGRRRARRVGRRVRHQRARDVPDVPRAVLPPMIERGTGDIINVASVSGKRPLPRRTPYCASKMAVIGLTTTLAAEVGPLGITVNSLSPGPVAGPRMDRNFRLEAERLGISVEEATEAFVSRALLHRMVTEARGGRGRSWRCCRCPACTPPTSTCRRAWWRGDVGRRGGRRRRAGGVRAARPADRRRAPSHARAVARHAR